jgi:hypothetical protein
MSRVYNIFVNPFQGLAESITTSNVVDTRFAFDITLSWRTTSGVTSVLTYQTSNDNTNLHGTITEATWSDWTVIGTTGGFSGSSTLDPPLGYGWARILREVPPASASSASFAIDMNVLYR